MSCDPQRVLWVCWLAWDRNDSNSASVSIQYPHRVANKILTKSDFWLLFNCFLDIIHSERARVFLFRCISWDLLDQNKETLKKLSLIYYHCCFRAVWYQDSSQSISASLGDCIWQQHSLLFHWEMYFQHLSICFFYFCCTYQLKIIWRRRVVCFCLSPSIQLLTQLRTPLFLILLEQ